MKIDPFFAIWSLECLGVIYVFYILWRRRQEDKIRKELREIDDMQKQIDKDKAALKAIEEKGTTPVSLVIGLIEFVTGFSSQSQAPKASERNDYPPIPKQRSAE